LILLLFDLIIYYFFIEYKFIIPSDSNQYPEKDPDLKIWKNMTKHNASMIWYCNRGVMINRWNESIKNSQLLCLCPPAYYGDRCEYENQRVSLSIRIQVLSDWRTLFVIVITLRDDEKGLIESFDHYNYLATHNCDKKFNIYLLYSTRPKNLSINYSVHIDIYKKDQFEYRASWLFPILFPFLPVYPLSVQLNIPIITRDKEKNCTSLMCGIHSDCFKYENTNKSFCKCNKGWFGKLCNIPYICNCSSDSLCIGPSICLCPTGKFGRFCHLKYSACECKNNGSCLLNDERMHDYNEFICICPEGFSGSQCEKNDTKIMIRFASEITIPKSILIHFIEVFGTQKPHIHSTIFKKIEIYEEMVTIYRSRSFHLIFIEIENKIYYYIFVQEKYIPSITISTIVNNTNHCLHIRELFNESFSELHVLRRMKYYHFPCQNHIDLSCFYDDIHMCICNSNLQQSNCFLFNHTITYNCQENNICENKGQCFEDYKQCPTLLKCVCDDCSYGSRCQFSTKGFEISLDAILGYHIQTNVTLSNQQLTIKMTITITTILLTIGLLNNILSILTFQSKELRGTSCGIYLLTSSITALITMSIFALKFYILIASQMMLITNRNYLSFNCILIDFIIKSFLNAIDWLNACVSVERAMITIYDVNYNKVKHKKAAKWIVMFIWILVLITNIQDPIYRRLIEDNEDNRIWCIVQYSPSLRIFNSIILIIHFSIPFLLNISSACIVIHTLARHRSNTQRQTTYIQQLRAQFQELKHILISPIIFILLALPRLIISFLSHCMKSARNPWLYLIGYFTSFIPPIFIFFVFVPYSKNYKAVFKKTINNVRQTIITSLANNANGFTGRFLSS